MAQSGLTAPVICVDADACPAGISQLVQKTARQRQLGLIFYSDYNHELNPFYGEVRQVSQGQDAVDMALLSDLKARDLVVTQDYGLAALALAKGAYAIHPAGFVFDNHNIDRLLFERHASAVARRLGRRMRTGGPKKPHEQAGFSRQLTLLLDKISQA